MIARRDRRFARDGEGGIASARKREAAWQLRPFHPGSGHFAATREKALVLLGLGILRGRKRVPTVNRSSGVETGICRAQMAKLLITGPRPRG